SSASGYQGMPCGGQVSLVSEVFVLITWLYESRHRRVVQNDGRCRNGPCPLSRFDARPDLPLWRASRCLETVPPLGVSVAAFKPRRVWGFLSFAPPALGERCHRSIAAA